MALPASVPVTAGVGVAGTRGGAKSPGPARLALQPRARARAARRQASPRRPPALPRPHTSATHTERGSGIHRGSEEAARRVSAPGVSSWCRQIPSPRTPRKGRELPRAYQGELRLPACLAPVPITLSRGHRGEATSGSSSALPASWPHSAKEAPVATQAGLHPVTAMAPESIHRLVLLDTQNDVTKRDLNLYVFRRIRVVCGGSHHCHHYLHCVQDTKVPCTGTSLNWFKNFLNYLIVTAYKYVPKP
jgi:hypothetical protein